MSGSGLDSVGSAFRGVGSSINLNYGCLNLFPSIYFQRTVCLSRFSKQIVRLRSEFGQSISIWVAVNLKLVLAADFFFVFLPFSTTDHLKNLHLFPVPVYGSEDLGAQEKHEKKNKKEKKEKKEKRGEAWKILFDSFEFISLVLICHFLFLNESGSLESLVYVLFTTFVNVYQVDSSWLQSFTKKTSQTKHQMVIASLWGSLCNMFMMGDLDVCLCGCVKYRDHQITHLELDANVWWFWEISHKK